jgi:hypothetical protein
MSTLNIFVYVECDFVLSHSTRHKITTVLSMILHLSIKHNIHDILPLDYYKKRWTDAWLG